MYNCYFYSESDHILEYTINFDYNDNTLYMVYAIDDCGFDEHRYICDYNKEKVLYKKLENILVDKLKNYHHEKIQYTKKLYYKLSTHYQRNYCKNFWLIRGANYGYKKRLQKRFYYYVFNERNKYMGTTNFLCK